MIPLERDNGNAAKDSSLPRSRQAAFSFLPFQGGRENAASPKILITIPKTQTGFTKSWFWYIISRTLNVRHPCRVPWGDILKNLVRHYHGTDITDRTVRPTPRSGGRGQTVRDNNPVSVARNKAIAAELMCGKKPHIEVIMPGGSARKQS